MKPGLTGIIFPVKKVELVTDKKSTEFWSVSTYNSDQFAEPKEVQEFQTT